MIRRKVRGWRINDADITHFPRRIGQDTVKRQKGAVGWKGAFGRSTQSRPNAFLRKRKATPGPPFIQVTKQDGLHFGTTAQVLTNDPHLKNAQGLGQRQMRRHYPAKMAIDLSFNGYCAPVAMPRQINDICMSAGKARMQKQDRPEEPITLRSPSQGRSIMDANQSSQLRSARHIQNTGVRAALAIGFLQGKNVASMRCHSRAYRINDPDGIDDIILTFGAMDIPCRTTQLQQDSGPSHNAVILSDEYPQPEDQVLPIP